jgi:hypothetical protein
MFLSLEMQEPHHGTTSHDTQIPATLEMGTLATSVNESLVYNDMEVSSVPRSTKIANRAKTRTSATNCRTGKRKLLYHTFHIRNWP